MFVRKVPITCHGYSTEMYRYYQVQKKHTSNVQSLPKSMHTCVQQQVALRTNGLPNSDLSDFTYIAKSVSSPLSQRGLGWSLRSKLTEGLHTTGHVSENALFNDVVNS